MSRARQLGAAGLVIALTRATPLHADPAPQDSAQVANDVGQPVSVEELSSMAPLRFPSTEERTKLSRELDAKLSQERFTFCNGSSYTLKPKDLPLCASLAQASKERCPTFAEACGNLDSKSHEFELPRTVPATVQAILRVMFWGLVLFAFVALVVWLLKHRVRRQPSNVDLPSPPPKPEPRVPLPTQLPEEKDVQRLLEQAAHAAGRGDFVAGVSALYAASVRRLEQLGHVQVRASATSGDYQAQLTPQPALREPFAQISASVERVQFAPEVDERATYEALRARVLGWLQQLALIMLAVALGLPTLGCEEHTRTWEQNGPHGTAVLKGLLEARGFDVRQRIRSLAKLNEETDVLILLDSVQAGSLSGTESDDEAAVRDAILARVDAGMLLVLTAPLGSLGEQLGVALSAPSPACVPKVRPLFEGSGDLPSLAASPGALKLNKEWHITAECDSEPFAATRAYGQGAVLALPHAELLRNLPLSAADNAEFLLAHLPDDASASFPIGSEAAVRPVVELADHRTGRGASTPYLAIQNANLSTLLLHAALWLALFYLYKGVPFGRPKPAEPPKRRAFTEHVRTLGELYARTASSRFALAQYGPWALDQLRRRLGSGLMLDLDELSERIAERTGRHAPDVLTVLSEADDTTPDGPDAPDRDLHLMRELSRYLHDLGGALDPRS